MWNRDRYIMKRNEDGDMDVDAFERELKLRTKYMDDVLEEALPKVEGLQKTVLEAMRYAVVGGGKRIRPILMLETYRMFGGGEEGEEALRPFLAAMEFLHTYSLVHDDLPSMDDDDLRRGRATTHVAYGEAMALLAGDALLNYAFEMVARGLGGMKDAARGVRAYGTFAAKAGAYGMIGGQVVDVQAADASLEALQYIYKNKTCALLEASMMMGAILAGAGDEDVAAIERVAENVGMAFQIKDDVLDVTGTEEMLGKPIGSDGKNQKVTYVTLKGLAEAEKAVREYTEKAVAGLADLPYDNPFLRDLVEWLIGRER